MGLTIKILVWTLGIFLLFWIVRFFWRTARLRRFRRVTPWLFRGGQPNPLALWILAKIFRVKTIINLREDFEPNPFLFGMKEIRILIPPTTNLPTKEQVQQFLNIVDSPENRPILVHCKVGANRTGFMIAMWRILRDGWTYEQALQEMEAISKKGIAQHLKETLYTMSKELEKEKKTS